MALLTIHIQKCQLLLLLITTHGINGAQITFFDQFDFQGESIAVEVEPGTCTNMPGNWNDRASSMNTNNECVIIFLDINCGGRNTRLEPDSLSQNRLDEINFDKAITSMYICTPPDKECASLTVNVDTTQAPDLNQFGEEAKKTMESFYSQICRLLISPTYLELTEIVLEILPTDGGVAWAHWFDGKVVANSNYYRDHQTDLGSMIHEMAHMIQRYPKCAGWVTEGIADWTRRYHYEPDKPTKPGPDDTYEKQPVFFLNWINEKYPDTFYTLNDECRSGTYEDDIFVKLTQRTPGQLWEDMMREA